MIIIMVQRYCSSILATSISFIAMKESKIQHYLVMLCWVEQ